MSVKDTAPLCSDPRADRQERETLVARALARGWAETPATQELIAAQLHTRPARVRAWLDTHSGESVPVAMLLGLPPPVVRRPVVALPFGTTIHVGTKEQLEDVEVRRVLRQNADFVVRVSTGEIIETRPLSARDIEEENARRQTTIEDKIAASTSGSAETQPPPEPTTGFDDALPLDESEPDVDFDEGDAAGAE